MLLQWSKEVYKKKIIQHPITSYATYIRPSKIAIFFQEITNPKPIQYINKLAETLLQLDFD